MQLRGRAYAYGAMDRRIDPSWWTHSAVSHGGLIVPSRLRGAYKRTLAATRKE